MNRVRQGVRVALPYVRPLLAVLILGGLVEAVLALLRERRSESLTGLFAAALTLAIIWTVVRLIPAAVRLTA